MKIQIHSAIRFTYTLLVRNYQGQVAIFVALIFQIIFILFALLINVGLLVHHKINLQQSADLAAYYGAIKQAEILNVVGHVNFQIRQAWKLLTWRYRVLGTFGVIDKFNTAPINLLKLPIKRNPNSQADSKFVKDSTDPTKFCKINNDPVNITNVPFMCLGHNGFKDWNITGGPGVGISDDESFCQADCNSLSQVANVINQVPTMGGSSNTGTNALIGTVNQALNEANAKLEKACKTIGPNTLITFAKFYQSYLQDTQNRKSFIKLLLANLSADPNLQKDIDGEDIRKGVIASLRNNLTEANNSSIKDEDIELSNGLYGTSCMYDAKEQRTENGTNNFVSEINFNFLQYFVMSCLKVPGSVNFSATSIYEPGTLNLNQTIYQQIVASSLPNAQKVADDIKQILSQNNYDHTLGFEKSPWCPIYYGIKVKSTPVIPFLPIRKITLHATAFAKPFGSSIGPWYGKTWSINGKNSNRNYENRVDKNLPAINFFSLSDQDKNTLSKAAKSLFLNYSNYVGDNLGLADGNLVGIYHDMLINKIVAGPNNQDPISNTKIDDGNIGKWTNPTEWPAFTNWDNISSDQQSPDYDPIAYKNNNGDKSNTYMRDIEISVVAPNQFEATYYPIEPDFYHVYLANRLEKVDVRNKIAGVTGMDASKIQTPFDYGYNKALASKGHIKDNFSIRNQIELVHKIIRKQSSTDTKNFGGDLATLHAKDMNQVDPNFMGFKFIPAKQSSFLTSWTFKDFVSDDYASIPLTEGTMKFAKCDDTKNFESLTETNNQPATSGNCNNGGRTGYSVKIVNERTLLGNSEAQYLNSSEVERMTTF